jgi:hypothetical protein
MSHMQPRTHKTHHDLDLGENHHLPPYNIFYASRWGLHLNGFLSWDSPSIKVWTLATLWDYNSTLRPLMRTRYEAKLYILLRVFQWYVAHHLHVGGWVDSRLFVVGSQTFCHNLCCRCPNGSCEPIWDIYISIAFQQYKELPNARCFDLCNCSLKVQESRWTPKLLVWECEFSSSHSLKTRVTTGGAQMDHGDGQEHVLGGQLGCGNLGQCSQTEGA